jgi:heme-degrading monooxygenase HmoA
MSLVIVVKLQADAAKVEEVLRAHADELAAISQDGRKAGAIHHQFVASDSEVVIIDEWDSADAFQQFFGSDPRIANLMQNAGVSAPPEINIYRTIDTSDRF